MIKSIIKFIKFRKNANKLINICSHYIDKYESNNPSELQITPSCKSDLMLEIKKRIYNDEEGISKLNEYTDWVSLANANIYSASFDLLISGNYHLYYGQLNPMKCTFCLMLVCRSSLKWALNNNIIDQESFDEQIQCLLDGIASIG